MMAYARRLADQLFSLLKILLACSLMVMFALVFSNVVLRYGFNSGISISEEIARLSFVWLTFLGAVLALRDRQHLAVNMLVSRLAPVAQKWIHVLRQLVILWVLWLVMDGGLAQVLIGLDARTPVAGLPLSVFSVPVLFSAVVMFLMVFLDLARALFSPAVQESVGRFQSATENTEEI